MQIEEFMVYVGTVRRFSPRTVERYRKVLEEYEAYSGGELSVQALRNYEVHLLDERKEHPRSVGQQLSILSSYCRYCVRTGSMSSNPVRLVSRPKTGKQLPVFYKAEDMEALFAATEADAGPDTLELLLSLPAGDPVAKQLYERRLDRMILSLLFCTGIRRAELIGLNRGSLHFARNTLSVLGKGDKMREIPLTASLCKEISLYLSAVDSILGGGHTAAAPLLLTPSGRRLYPVYVDRAVKRLLGATVGITGRKSPHVLRHTLATELLDSGTDLNAIKELLGHGSLAATQVYTHNSVERLKKVYENAHPRAKKGGTYGH